MQFLALLERRVEPLSGRKQIPDLDLDAVAAAEQIKRRSCPLLPLRHLEYRLQVGETAGNDPDFLVLLEKRSVPPRLLARLLRGRHQLLRYLGVLHPPKLTSDATPTALRTGAQYFWSAN